jgi:hypothetical protein
VSDGKRAVWLIVMGLAGFGLIAEMTYIEMSLTKLVLCILALSVMIFAYWRQRGDGKTLHPVRPHAKSRRNKKVPLD